MSESESKKKVNLELWTYQVALVIFEIKKYPPHIHTHTEMLTQNASSIR